MRKNKPFSHTLFQAGCPPVGGQAVLDGVMMRNGDVYSLAVRMPDGSIYAERLPWRVLTRGFFFSLPFVRGFPILLETLINGVHALNRSAALSESGAGAEESSPAWQFYMGVFMALIVAAGMFVLAPHVLSLLMLFLGLGGDVEGFSFHLWDGFYKCAIFLCYIWLISFIPDIKRVFEYHGAEHKTIHAYETGEPVSARFAWYQSRLHPRCGTTFLLFVICVSIVVQALLVPLLLKIWRPEGLIAKHALSLLYKLALTIPISAISYELIRFAARLPTGPLAAILQGPGLFLQRLTTREPDQAQLEVAVTALAEALRGEEDGERPINKDLWEI